MGIEEYEVVGFGKYGGHLVHDATLNAYELVLCTLTEGGYTFWGEGEV